MVDIPKIEAAQMLKVGGIRITCLNLKKWRVEKMRVYLAGKMTGLTIEQMTKWRNIAKKCLQANQIQVLDPCQTGNFQEAKEIVASNKFMIDHSELVLAEMDYDEPSIGTICEIVYANTKGIPVMGWGGATEIIDHPWINTMITSGFFELENALKYIIENYGLPEVNHA
jgi:nucleoside 2-deoxyribosyltransferase